MPSPVEIAALLIAGLIGGFINTLAGGGSMLTLPALMMMGMPADIANGTNRVGVLLQSLTGVKGFRDQDKLDSGAIVPVLVPTLGGALSGALLASYLPVTFLKPALLITMVCMALVMLIKPGAVVPEPGTVPYRVSERPAAAFGLFFAGLYGGFVQAGVGFILLAALAGGLRYDLVRANAMKMVCSLAFTLVALAIFLYFDQVRWVPGLILAVGNMLGTWVTVRFAVMAKQSTIKWFLFVMTLCSCVAALFF